MRQEMRNLNRVKYAHSDEEVKRLASQGFVPVGPAAEQSASQEQASDDGGQSTVPVQESDDNSQTAVPAQVSGGADQTSDPSVQKKRKDAGKK